MTPAEKQYVIDLKRQGKTCARIADELHYSLETIRKIGTRAYENQKARQRQKYAEQRRLINGLG